MAPSPGSTLKPGLLLGCWGEEPVASLGSHSVRELPGPPLQEGTQTPHPTVQSTAGGGSMKQRVAAQHGARSPIC